MIGIMHELLLDFAQKNLSEENYSKARRQAGVSESQNYKIYEYVPDEDWRRLLGATFARMEQDNEQCEELLGKYIAEVLYQRFPGFLKDVKTTQDVILRHPKIHNAIAASLRDAEEQAQVAQKFRLERKVNEMIVHYMSRNRLCTLYKGMARWFAELLQEDIAILELQCMKKGDPECEIHIKYFGDKYNIDEKEKISELINENRIH